MSGNAYNFMGPAVNQVIACPMVFDNTVNSGIVKLAQRVIVLFLKDKETSTNPSLGTDIVQMVGSGNGMMSGELNNYMTLAANTIMGSINNVQDPLDEQAASITIIPTVNPIDPTSVIATIRVVSRSGETATATTTV